MKRERKRESKSKEIDAKTGRDTEKRRGRRRDKIEREQGSERDEETDIERREKEMKDG